MKQNRNKITIEQIKWCYPLGDAIAKLIGTSVPLVQLLLVRFMFQVVLLLPIVLATNGRITMTGRVLRLTIVRTLLHIAGIAAMFGSLRFLPLADAIAIAFVMPFVMLLLGKYILKEEVGRFRLTACVVGFAGTLLVIQPSFATVGAPALLPLLVAVVFALFMLVTRQIAKEVDAVELQAVSGIFASVLLGILIFAFRDSGIDDLGLTIPGQKAMWLLCAIGVIGTVAHLLMTWSLRFAPSATLAPMQYIEIPVATVYGWLLFRDLPNGLAAVGIGITIAAGLVVIFREQANAKRLKSAAQS